MADAAPPQPPQQQAVKAKKKSRSKVLPLLGLLVGALGVGVAFFPDLAQLDAEKCPYLPPGSASTLEAVTMWWRTTYASVLMALPFLPGSDYRVPRPETWAVDPASGLPVFTPADLARYRALEPPAKDDPSAAILLSIGGDVFNVGPIGRQFYGAEAPYRVFAGIDATRPLTLGTLEGEDIDRGSDISDLNAQQLKNFEEQLAFYRGKYPLVGKLSTWLDGRLPRPAGPDAAPSPGAPAQPSGSA